MIIILNSGFSCTEDFLQEFKRHIEEVIPKVQPGVPFTVKQLCSKSYWQQRYFKGECPIAGMCMDRLVESGQLPFENVPRNGKNPYPLLYKIKNTG